MELTSEEQQMILERRKGVDTKQSMAGIGTGGLFWKARLKKKKFLDYGIYIEKEGNRNVN